MIHMSRGSMEYVRLGKRSVKMSPVVSKAAGSVWRMKTDERNPCGDGCFESSDYRRRSLGPSRPNIL